MNDEKEVLTNINIGGVPLEDESSEPIFQNAGGPGKVLSTEENGQVAPSNRPLEESLIGQNVQNGDPIVAPSQFTQPFEEKQMIPKVDENIEMPEIQVDPNVPVMQVNPNVELKSIHLDKTEDEGEYDEYEEYEEPEKTEADIALEKRNKIGLRFIVIFGLVIMIFILLLPWLITII